MYKQYQEQYKEHFDDRNFVFWFHQTKKIDCKFIDIFLICPFNDQVLEVNWIKKKIFDG